MTWVHMLRYDAMIHGSLLLVCVVFALTLLALGMAWLGLWTWRTGASHCRARRFRRLPSEASKSYDSCSC
jgi:hypothetical protein